MKFPRKAASIATIRTACGVFQMSLGDVFGLAIILLKTSKEDEMV